MLCDFNWSDNLEQEGISSPGEIPLEFCDDTDFFLDNLDSDLPSFSPAACSISAATSTSTTTSSSNTMTNSEGPCCFVDDNASFTLDPAAISALFNCQQPYESNQLDHIPHAAATYQLPVAPVYDQGQFQQSICTDAINGGCYSLLLPDSLAVQIPAGPPGQQLPPEYGEYLAPLPPMPGYAGLDPTPSCSFLDAPATNGYYPDAMGMGFFSRAMMIGLEPEMVADGGAVAMPEAVQRVYSSGDMQVHPQNWWVGATAATPNRCQHRTSLHLTMSVASLPNRGRKRSTDISKILSTSKPFRVPIKIQSFDIRNRSHR